MQKAQSYPGVSLRDRSDERATLRELIDTCLRNCANSFRADTLIATPDGAKPIGAIKIGDHVLAYDQTSGTTGSFTVTVQVKDASSPQQTATQPLTITVSAAYTVVFSVQPSNTNPGSQITPSVKVVVTDSKGKTVRGAVCQASLAVNPGNAVLTGTSAQMWMHMQADHDVWHALRDIDVSKIEAVERGPRLVD